MSVRKPLSSPLDGSSVTAAAAPPFTVGAAVACLSLALPAFAFFLPCFSKGSLRGLVLDGFFLRESCRLWEHPHSLLGTQISDSPLLVVKLYTAQGRMMGWCVDFCSVHLEMST